VGKIQNGVKGKWFGAKLRNPHMVWGMCCSRIKAFQRGDVTIYRIARDGWRNNRLFRFMNLRFNAWRVKRLRRMAWYAKNEQLRIRAAQKLKDVHVLKQLALEANQESIRHQAAMLIESETFLTAIALNAWDIEQGRKVVERIDNALLLRRVSTCARQDAVRMAAALKLQNTKVLKQIALTTADLSLRWEVAQRLNDPGLMAGVALFKPSKPHLETYRQQAHGAMLRHLDDLSFQGQTNALLAFMHDQAHLPFKIEAFLRLPLDLICQSTLQHLSHNDFAMISGEMVQRMFLKMRTAGWLVRVQAKCFSCKQCRGNGQVLIKTIFAGQLPMENESMVCPECSGKGWIDYWAVVCSRRESQRVTFKMPYPKLSGSEPSTGQLLER